MQPRVKWCETFNAVLSYWAGCVLQGVALRMLLTSLQHECSRQ